ncbi:MAG: tetratricopeptide repeat protein [bacterium]|nr:tetratricopeptide repeat protein [bacterium]
MKSNAAIIGIIFLCLLTTGCGTFGTMSSKKSSEQIAAEYLAKAREYENKGDLVEALKQYNLVLTVDPDNRLAQDKSAQIGQELKRLAQNHYRSGMAYYNKGRYALARQEFLTALRYDPQHLQAKDMLTVHRELEQIARYVMHTIQPNESISSLAKRYYGDYKKFHLIALYNDLVDAAKVKVGQQIKIPVLKGIPIMVDPSKIQTDTAKASQTKPYEIISVKGFIIHTVKAEDTLSKLAKKYYGDYKKFNLIAKFNNIQVSDSLRVGQEIKIPEFEGIPILATEDDKKMTESVQPEPAPVEEEIPQKEAVVEPQIEQLIEQLIEKVETTEEDPADGYRKLGIELYNNEQYSDAIIELQKVLNTNPDDKIARNYMALTYFELGYASFNKADYSQAIKDFERSLQYDSNCKRCDTYIEWSEESFKDLHYRKGVSYFGEEKLAEAISEWELIYKVDPDYKDVEKNIEKARNLMERLDEIKKSKDDNDDYN